ncbi:MAG TPA: hypothetical protein VK701_01260 [Solirubrobacteraceae bacterium]|jgi:hypothetical protein|nr:hypothetical protein [Solirubrobacteraceae bacterium]
MVRFDTWRVIERDGCWVVLDRTDRVVTKQDTRDEAVAMVHLFHEIAADIGTYVEHRRSHPDDP